MRRSKCHLGMLVAALIAGTAACSYSGGLLGPIGPPYRISGQVFDDSLYLPPSDSRQLTVSGARVEVVVGPEKGRFAITNTAGGYDLGELSADSTIRASKDGWEPRETVITGWTGTSPWLFISEAPHCVWGFISLPGEPGQQARAPGVKVLIVDGPNAGQSTLSDASGLYRFDNIPTKASFSIEFSKDGYLTERRVVGPIDSNTQVPWGLKAK